MGLMTGNIVALVAKSGHTIDLERPAQTEDDLGGRDRTWGTVTSGVSCWVQPSGASTVERYAERTITVTHTAYFAVAPAAQIGDRLLFGTRYMVVEGVENVAETTELWMVHCREVRAVA